MSVIILTFRKRLAIDWGLSSFGKENFGLLALGFQFSESFFILGNINTIRLLLEVGYGELEKFFVEILTTQMGVTFSGLNLEDTFLDADDRNVTSTTTDVENENVFLTPLLSFIFKAKSNGSSCWFVDQLEDVEAGEGSCIQSGLSLSVVEIGWDGDDSV